MICKKAIIPVAGFGTRRLPITKAVEKCMLPVLNRPIIDYVVEDCVKAGIEEVVFVVNATSHAQLSAFYGKNIELEAYLSEKGKESLIASITPPDLHFRYVTQEQNGLYGTAIPVALCRGIVEKGEAALVLMGDDFLYRQDGGSDIADMLRHAQDGQSMMLGVQVPIETVSNYGVLKMDKHNLFEAIIEKPLAQDAPSNLINVSKYLMTSELLDEIDIYARENVEGEHAITEPINRFVRKGGVMKVFPNKGIYCDGGTVEGWLQANQTVFSHSNPSN